MQTWQKSVYIPLFGHTVAASVCKIKENQYVSKKSASVAGLQTRVATMNQTGFKKRNYWAVHTPFWASQVMENLYKLLDSKVLKDFQLESHVMHFLLI